MKKTFGIISFSILLSTIFINTAFALPAGGQAEIMLFVGDGCPHCANVEQYMTENNVLGRLPIKVYEVWNHPENQPLYLQKAQEVGYTKQGVPFMVDGSHYEVGDTPIISYFADLLNKQDLATVADLQKDSKPVQPASEPSRLQANVLSSADSDELNDIMEEKVEAGEKSELKDPDTLYDAANGINTENETTETSIFDEVKTFKDLTKSPLFWAIAGFVIIDIIVVLYLIKKKTS